MKEQPTLYGPGDQQREQTPEVRDTVGNENYRSSWRRDYARIIHSAAFRRLQGKTQLFPSIESDFFRTRLTHSLEVAQVGKSIAHRLNERVPFFASDPINPEIVEVAGLVHDLGHPPFGHNGEKALDDSMKGYGGFEGNAQTLRILCKLEKKDAQKALDSGGVDTQGRDHRLGLNLTYRSILSALKYDAEISMVRDVGDKIVKGYYQTEAALIQRAKSAVVASLPPDINFKTIECGIMDIADDISYSTYDLEDSFKAGFFSPLDIISSSPELLQRVADEVSKRTGLTIDRERVLSILYEVFDWIFPDPKQINDAPLPYLVAQSYVISKEVCTNGFVRTSFTSDLISEFISGVEVDVNEDIPQLSVVRLASKTLEKVEVLKTYTYEAMIMSPRLKVLEHRGYGIIRDIFDKLSDERGHLLLPDDYRDLYERSKTVPARKRVICDFIAGMTDRYAFEFFGRLNSENSQTIFKPL